jgi:hypothetical protein
MLLELAWPWAAFLVVYLVGVFSSQWLKDTINGVPAELRTALSSAETSAVGAISAAKTKAIADVTNSLPHAAAKKAAAPVAAAPAAPVAAAPAAPVAAAPAAPVAAAPVAAAPAAPVAPAAPAAPAVSA